MHQNEEEKSEAAELKMKAESYCIDTGDGGLTLVVMGKFSAVWWKLWDYRLCDYIHYHIITHQIMKSHRNTHGVKKMEKFNSFKF